jgi:pimeloyl-ACP methyl ester carboxylesterase
LENLAAEGPSWQPGPESGIRIKRVQANGQSFEVAELDAQVTSGDHLALCLHGFPELNVSWRHQMPMLAKRGYRVWAPNLRGYGATSRPHSVRDYGLDHLTDDVAGLIDASGAKKVTILAHDWGAVIAWCFAIRDLCALEQLVIMNVPHPMVFRREIRTWEQFKKSWYMFFFQIPWLPETRIGAQSGDGMGGLIARTSAYPEKFDSELRAIYSAAARRPRAARAMVNYYRAAFRFSDVVDLGDAKVDVPTLMIWGEDDVALGLGCTEGTEEWVADLTLKRLPGISHWVQQDAPEQVNAILEEWLLGAS